MFKLLVTVVLLGGVCLGGAALWRDPGLRQAAWDKAGGVLDDLVGIHNPRAPKDKEKVARPVLPVKALHPVKESAPDIQVVTTPKAAPTPYVDRSPTPLAVERVKESDRQWLSDVIAKKADVPAARR